MALSVVLAGCGGQPADGSPAGMMRPEHVAMVSLYDQESGVFYSISDLGSRPTVMVQALSVEQIPGDEMPSQVAIDRAVFDALRDRAMELTATYPFDPGVEGDPATSSSLNVLFGSPGLTSLTLDMAFAPEDPAFRALRDAVAAAVVDSGE